MEVQLWMDMCESGCSLTLMLLSIGDGFGWGGSERSPRERADTNSIYINLSSTKPCMVINLRTTTTLKFPKNDEAALRKAVANQPVSVPVDAGDYTFQFNKRGVFMRLCGTMLDQDITA
nr:senescence-specific cysteine protease SAG39-like [Ipomoea batatas]